MDALFILKHAVKCEGGGKKPIYRPVSPEIVQTGAWNRIIMPLNGFNVRGDLSQVSELHIYLAEKWYPDKVKLDFIIDDVALLKEYEDKAAYFAGVRKPEMETKIPEAYRELKRPAAYPVYPLEFIYADTDLSNRGPLRKIAFRGAPAERRSFTFALVAAKEGIQNLSIELTGLKRADGRERIGPEAFDPRVVKVWEQAALHWAVHSPEDAIVVPELLLKDDRLPLNDSRTSEGRYQPPHVLNAQFGTDIPAFSQKQVWISVDIPANAGAGQYKGFVRLEADKGLPSMALPMEVEVLPFVLPPARQFYTTYMGVAPGGSSASSISFELFKRDIEELASAGFDSIFVARGARLEDQLVAMKEVGMTGPVVVKGGDAGQVTDIKATAAKHGFDICFYGIDEPNSKVRYDRHMKASAEIHKGGGKAVTAIKTHSARKLIADGEPLDWANLTLQAGSQAALYERMADGKEEPVAPFQTYCWQYYIENPTMNRFFAGMFLWRCGFDGAFPYVWRRIPKGLPYTSDARPGGGGRGANRTFRAWCLTYPSLEGPVATLQWEGIREGIIDCRYLTLLEQRIAEARNAGESLAADEAMKKMDKIVRRAAKLPVTPSIHTNPYKNPDKMVAAREQIIDLILSLE